MRRPLQAVLFALLMPLGVAAAQQPDPDAKAAAILNPLSSLDLESLEATRTFPLFSPSRRPPVVPEPPAAAVEPPPPPPPLPSPPPLDLIGIVMTDSTQVALLVNRETGGSFRLSAGEEYDGWSIAFVDARTVEFRNGDQVKLLKMFDAFNPNNDLFGSTGGFVPLDQ